MEKRGRETGDQKARKRVVGEVLGGAREEWTEGKGRNGREGLRRRRRTRKGEGGQSRKQEYAHGGKR
jgi:hypothetical protein